MRNVEDFTAGLSEDGLKLLLPCLTKLTSLTINLTEPSSQALRICAATPSLRSFKLDFDARTIVRAKDLILFAETHISLESLELGSYEEDNLSAADGDITDATMDQVARLLPNLESLECYMAGTSVTEASLLSLCTFCKRFDSCSMYGSFFFEELVRSATSNLWPALRSLRLRQPALDRRPENRRVYTDPEDMAKRILQAAPRLWWFDLDFVNATDGDIALHNAVAELINIARRGYYSS